MSVTFFVEGAARGKQRPRTVRKGGVTRTYTPQETKLYEYHVQCAYKREADGAFFDGPVSVIMTIFETPPKSASKAEREKMLSDRIRPTKRPDLDNVAKSVCDALNKTAYKDDAQIVRLCVSRYYREKSGVMVTISEVQNEFTLS